MGAELAKNISKEVYHKRVIDIKYRIVDLLAWKADDLYSDTSCIIAY